MRRVFTWFAIIAIAFVAYTYGAKAGRGRYRDIRATAEAIWNDPKFKKARKEANKQSKKAADAALKQAKKKVGH